MEVDGRLFYRNFGGNQWMSEGSPSICVYFVKSFRVSYWESTRALWSLSFGISSTLGLWTYEPAFVRIGEAMKRFILLSVLACVGCETAAQRQLRELDKKIVDLEVHLLRADARLLFLHGKISEDEWKSLDAESRRIQDVNATR